MAMRITTKMMQSKSLYNINSNKTLQEQLTTQLSTMKKITRPSDDPVVAIRSLKLNSTLNRIDQYYEKNCNDANSWLTLTESAISTTSDIITSMRKYIIQAAQGSLEASDRAAILENLSNYRTEIYSTGNADSDGRSIFTGYRTNMSLTFQETTTCKYEITEQKTNSCLDTVTYVRTGDLSSINEGNFDTKSTTEYDVGSYEVGRIRTAYSNLDYNDAATSSESAAKLNISFLVDTQKASLNDKKGITINTTSYSLFAQTDSATPGQLTMQVDGTSSFTLYTTQDAATAAGATPTNSTITIDGTTYTVLSEQVLPSGASLGDAGSTVVYSCLDGDGNVSLQIQEYSNLNTDSSGNASLYKTTSLGLTETANTDGSVTFTYDDQYETKLTVTDYKSTSIDSTTNEGAYMEVYGDENADNIVYVADTGEILLGSNIQAQLAALSYDTEIRFTYEKTNWEDGDLNPVHYFYTKKYDDADTNLNTYEAADTYIEYNAEKLTGDDSDLANQYIYYDIGNNQKIRVNTVASDVYTHDIGRDVDEVVTMLEEYETLLSNYDSISDMIDSGTYDGDELEKLESQQAALEKACTLAKSKVQDTCEGLITTFDNYIQQTTLAYTDVGARDSRLELIENRLSAQQTNYKELVSENEDADVTDLAIQLSSVELTYEAALSSISYVMKTSLLDFI